MKTATAFVFGSAQAPPAAPRRLLVAYSQLPEVGILYSKSQLRRLWTTGKFPRPVKLSMRRLAWAMTDLEAWVAAKVKESKC